MHKDILVHLDRTAHSDHRLAVAAGLAARFGATLVGLRVEVHPHVPNAIRAGIPAEALAAQADAITADTARIRDGFHAAARAAGVPALWWMDTGGGVEQVCRRARHAGLTVAGAPDADHEEELPAGTLVHHLLMTAGRPVLVVPDAGAPGVPGARVAVAWDGSREASRAVADAMPILAAAAEVLLFRVGEGADSLTEAAAHLARNGVGVRSDAVPAGARGVGPAILDAAAGFGADLLVMGGYGHSRLAELVLGGATRHVLHHAAIPVLMAH
ncbi:universal stress protein [Azospirillum halopraeferens]|uniref:universal stress protein n=1 Tax=Azospirillum halopraeferens TaxID=34010 RepID=UPI00041BE4B9|nr:universal stress protein [Azospirillum halopraeferens]